MIPLGIITDEVGDDLREACRHVRSWGLDLVELRLAWGKNVVQWSDEEVDRAAEIVTEAGLTVTAIASPVFKSPIDERPRRLAADFALEGVESIDAQLELLDRACVVATRLGAPYVRVFTFWDEPWTAEVDDRLVDAFARAASVAAAHDVTLAIENEPVCLVGTGRELARICALLNERLPSDLRSRAGALWDPGNALAGGESDPYPGGFDAVGACRLVHVHLKDLVLDAEGTPSFVPLGEGDVDFDGQLRALSLGGYPGSVVLEPHYHPAHLARHEAALACVEAARAALAAAAKGAD